MKNIESIPSIIKKDRRSTGAIRSFGIKRGENCQKHTKNTFFSLSTRTFFVFERSTRSIRSRSKDQKRKDRIPNPEYYQVVFILEKIYLKNVDIHTLYVKIYIYIYNIYVYIAYMIYSYLQCSRLLLGRGMSKLK